MSYLRKMRGLNARAIGRVSVVGIVSASFALLSGAPVYASERSLVLEEVIVTARKKDESRLCRMHTNHFAAAAPRLERCSVPNCAPNTVTTRV